MTTKELEKVIGGTISESIKTEYIRATNELVKAIISYIDAKSADEMLKSMKEVSKAHKKAMKIVNEKFKSKTIDINEHLRLYKNINNIMTKYVMQTEHKAFQSSEDFQELLIEEEKNEGKNIQEYITKEKIENMKVGDKIVFTSESGTKFRIKKTNETERCFAFYNITNKIAICSRCKIDYILTTTVY